MLGIQFAGINHDNESNASNYYLLLLLSADSLLSVRIRNTVLTNFLLLYYSLQLLLFGGQSEENTKTNAIAFGANKIYINVFVYTLRPHGFQIKWSEQYWESSIESKVLTQEYLYILFLYRYYFVLGWKFFSLMRLLLAFTFIIALFSFATSLVQLTRSIWRKRIVFGLCVCDCNCGCVCTLTKSRWNRFEKFYDAICSRCMPVAHKHE